MSIWDEREKELLLMDQLTTSLCALRLDRNINSEQWVELVGQTTVACFDLGRKQGEKKLRAKFKKAKRERIAAKAAKKKS